MFDAVLNNLSEEDRDIFRTFFTMPVFRKVIDENLEKLEAQVWSLDAVIEEGDSQALYAQYKIMQHEYLLWRSLKNLMLNVEGTSDVPQIQTFN